MQNYANLSTILRSKGPTPLLNRPDIDWVFRELPLDGQGLLRAVEMVALPDTRFRVVKEISPTIVEVKTEDYLSKGPLYLDTRFTVEDMHAPARKRALPSIDAILSHLESSLGLPYIWGGNWGAGISEMKQLYPADAPLKDEATYFLRGVDCSGLLYEATDGYTPRNTSDLISFGKRVHSLSDIKPLDLIIWPGHVIICMGQDSVIESLLGHGVILGSLRKRIAALGSKKIAVRRFIPRRRKTRSFRAVM